MTFAMPKISKPFEVIRKSQLGQKNFARVHVEIRGTKLTQFAKQLNEKTGTSESEDSASPQVFPLIPSDQPAGAARLPESKGVCTSSCTKNKKQDAPIPLEQLKWLTVAQAALRYSGAFTEKSLRHWIALAEQYQKYPKSGLRSNGLIDCIARPGNARKILINAERFEQWIESWSVNAR